KIKGLSNNFIKVNIVCPHPGSSPPTLWMSVIQVKGGDPILTYSQKTYNRAGYEKGTSARANHINAIIIV
ncbi:MAG: hypothetical protein ABH879_01800, partial [archaeon]